MELLEVFEDVGAVILFDAPNEKLAVRLVFKPSGKTKDVIVDDVYFRNIEVSTLEASPTVHIDFKENTTLYLYKSNGQISLSNIQKPS